VDIISLANVSEVHAAANLKVRAGCMNFHAYSNLKMETVCSSKMMETLSKSTRCKDPRAESI
jgi:hypothetical protein